MRKAKEQIRLVIEEVENGFVVSETIIEEETEHGRTYGEEMHVFHTVGSMVQYFVERFEKES